MVPRVGRFDKGNPHLRPPEYPRISTRILYIDIELRPDHLSCSGCHRADIPPHGCTVAAGVRFTNYYATDTPCLPGRTAVSWDNSGSALE